MPPSPIRKLVPFADAAKRAGKQVIHLNIGQPDIKAPEVVMETMRNLDIQVIEYSQSGGFPSYREGLSHYYKQNNIDVDADHILVTTGGSEALLFTMLSCFDPGDEIIIPAPFYANYNGYAATAGVDIIPVTSTISTGFSLPPVEEFERLISEQTKGILICNPGNPSGYLYSEAELEALAEICRQHDLYLIADEVYREFTYDGQSSKSILNLRGLENNAIVVDSVSKRYSMCGARIGALITRNEDVISTALKFAQARLSPPTFGQIAAEAALQTPKAYFDRVIDEYSERRNILVEGLNAIDGVMCPKPGGAFYCMAQLPVDDTDRFCQWLLESFEHNGKTVMMAPGRGFYTSGALGYNQVRIAYVLEKEILKQAIECLDVALKEYPGRDEEIPTFEMRMD